jgi:hypothetical protein
MRRVHGRGLEQMEAQALYAATRKPMATPLQTKEERGKTRGRAFAYARQLLLDRDKLNEMKVGRSPFAHIDAETIAQRAWADGYVARIRDERKGKCRGCGSPDPDNLHTKGCPEA